MDFGAPMAVEGLDNVAEEHFRGAFCSEAKLIRGRVIKYEDMFTVAQNTTLCMPYCQVTSNN